MRPRAAWVVRRVVPEEVDRNRQPWYLTEVKEWRPGVEADYAFGCSLNHAKLFWSAEDAAAAALTSGGFTTRLIVGGSSAWMLADRPRLSHQSWVFWDRDANNWVTPERLREANLFSSVEDAVADQLSYPSQVDGFMPARIRLHV